MEEIVSRCLPTYRLVDKIGQGLYGSVYRVRDPFKERAVKVVPITVERSLDCRLPEEMDSRLSRDFHAVREYYESIKGPGVVEVYDFHLVPNAGGPGQTCAWLVILMELCPENLRDHVLDRFPLSPDSARRLLANLAATMNRLESLSGETFLLSDFKPSNLLLNSRGELVIGDLGGLRRLETVSAADGGQFTPNWSAPEFILRGAVPDVASAVYCYGLVAYFVWEGHLPYEKADFAERIGRMRNEGVRFSRAGLAPELRELIRECLAFDARKRPGGFGPLVRRLAPPARAGTARPRGDGPKAEGEPAGRRRRPGRAPGTLWREPWSAISMVWVPGGCFSMQTETGDRPPREICLDGFWLGRYPVTQGQWLRVMGGDNPAHFSFGSDYPVEQVSWEDATSFLRRLMRRTGGRYHFDLPLEAQWEYAARNMGRPQTATGADDPGKLGWHRENSGFASHPVGRKPPNELGIHDMCGNVMEWCRDPYVADALPAARPSAEASGPRADRLRVVRGGGWNQPAHDCRTGARAAVRQRLRYTHLGFRIVRDPARERSPDP